MKPLAWLSILGWCACASAGCSTSMSSSSAAPQGDPVGFTFKSTAGSFASFGWTGAVHNVVQPPGTPFGVQVTKCEGSVCQFEGPSDPVDKVNRRRCLFRMSKTCGTDADCPIDGGLSTPCVYIYDAPLATPLLGADKKIGACAWSYIPIAAAGLPPTIAGSLNLASGALNLVNLTVLLPLNSNPVTGTFRGACAECVGDKASNDGVRDGHCEVATHRGDLATAADADMSPDLGMPCDVNRGGDFDGYGGNYSMDCSPTVARSPNPPLQFGGSFNSAGFQVLLGKDSPTCTTGGQCFCGMCSDNMTACLSNANCGTGQCRIPTLAECQPNPPKGVPGNDPTLQVNQCKADPSRFAVAGNACADGQCNWDPAAGTGTCKLGPDGPIIGCYPSGAMAGIMAPGHAEQVGHIGTTYLVDTATASCIAAGGSATLNSQLGLPGLLFQKRNFQITPEYAENKQ
jgi:hypothetical protein